LPISSRPAPINIALRAAVVQEWGTSNPRRHYPLMGAAAPKSDASPGRKAGPGHVLRTPPTAGTVLDPGLTDRALARAAGSLPVEGNAVRLLQDAAENYPA